MRGMKKTLLVGGIIVLVLSVTGVSIFLGWWYRPIKKIEIYDDKEFWKYHFPGEGTATDPYIISGYTFTDIDRHAIRIYDTTKHFVIRDCKFLTSTYTAIEISNTGKDRVEIKSNQFSNLYFAIILWSIDGIIIEDNTFENNRRAMDEQGLGRFTIRNNIFKHEAQNDNDGFFFWGIFDTIIENNTFINLDVGFSVSDVLTIKIRNNTFIDCKTGFLAYYCSGLIIENNFGYNGSTGFNIANSEYVSIINNTFTNYSGSGFWLSSSFGCVVKFNNASFCGYFGMRLYNLVNSQFVSNYCGNNTMTGIWIFVCDLFLVSKNIFENNKIGMDIDRSRITELVYNTIKHNAEYGITTTGSYNRTIYNNNFIDNYYTNQTYFAQAYDDGNYTDIFGITNWYDNLSTQGNYWSDLVWFVGANYTIDGIIGNIDLYPSENQIVIPS